jgi:hypothetical protein
MSMSALSGPVWWRAAFVLSALTLTIAPVFQSVALGTTTPVYRFWSGLHRTHFYTIKPDEAERLVAHHPASEWRYEGIAFVGFSTGDSSPDTEPVRQYRVEDGGVFDYHVGPTADAIDGWQTHGVAFRAFPVGLEPEQALPVYAFVSALTGGRYFTQSNSDRDTVLAGSPDNSWLPDGIAWYALPANTARPAQSIALSWVAAEPADDVDGYEIYLETKQHTPDEAVDQLLEVLDVGNLDDPSFPRVEYATGPLGLDLRSGDRPCFRIKAYGSGGASVFSSEVCTFIP